MAKIRVPASPLVSHHSRRRLHSTLRRLVVGLTGVAAAIKTQGDVSEGKKYGMGLCLQPRRPTISWAASPAAWAAGQGRQFCPSALLL